MAPAFVLELVTPEAPLLEGEAEAIVLRTSDGDLTVLDGHTPLVGDVRPGVIRVLQPEGVERRIAVHGGFLQVDTGFDVAEEAEAALSGTPQARGSLSEGGLSTRVTLLAGVAELAEGIDVPRAQQAKEAAEARLVELRGARGGPERPSGAEGEAEGEQQVRADELQLAEDALARAELRLAVAGGQV